jgi:hypothetical protein
MLEEMFFFIRSQSLNVFKTRWMVVLGPPKIYDPLADLHAVEHAQCLFSACIICKFTERVPSRVVLPGFLYQMKAFKAAIPLQEIFYLVFGVLLWEASDKKFTGAVVNLS